MSTTAPQGDDASSTLSTSPLALSADVAALLNDFLSEREDREKQLQALADEQAAAEEGKEEKGKVLSPAQFVQLFTEDWQLSQFWYTPAFSERLAKALCALVSGHERIAFLCAPSAYVGTRYHLAQHPDSPARDVSLHLFECDSRFATFARDDFVRYDLDEPLVLPEELVGQIDIAIVDPPFLNRVTNDKLAQSLQQLLKPTGKLILITSPAVDGLDDIYKTKPLGPLQFSSLNVVHCGLKNDFALMTSWEGGERFGEP